MEARPGDGARHQTDGSVRLDASLEGIAGVKPIIEGGLLTAASASQISDGAAALLVASEAAIRAHGLSPLARIVHLDVLGHDPATMLDAPIPATRRASGAPACR